VDFRVFLEPQQGATYDDQVAVAQAAESLGFSAFFRSDHYLAMSGDGLPGPTDSWVTLAGIARETSSIRLGTLVTSATFRHPGPLAISVAQVDAMSAGRVEFGIGAGWFEAEHRAYAIPFPALGERFDRLEEQLEIITGMWSTPVGETFDYAGTYYPVTDSPALPKPVQRPHPPIIIGGGGAKRTPALAARFAAEFNLAFPTLEFAGVQLGRVQAALDAIGRAGDDIVYSAAFAVCAGRDKAQIARRADAIGREVDELRANTPLVGTPAEIVDRLGPFAEAGVQRVYLQLLDASDLDHLELFASEVMRQVGSPG
jgi:F420-dependent oxidoreductase-like protein